MKKITFTVPIDQCEAVKAAMFAAGAGWFNDYDRQCFQTLGYAEFRPLEGAEPRIGRIGMIERVAEWRVEMFCGDEVLAAALGALRSAHPYEGPQVDVISIENDLTILR